jgi:hypothetical protein
MSHMYGQLLIKRFFPRPTAAGGPRGRLRLELRICQAELLKKEFIITCMNGLKLGIRQ